jgi:hypothetical protein
VRRQELRNKAHFIGIYDESTLNLLPLFVRELDDVLYSVAFEEDLRLKDGGNWKKGFQ